MAGRRGWWNFGKARFRIGWKRSPLNMNNGSGHDPSNSPRLPDWEDCEYFCIHDYAGTAVSPCGWRGRLHEANLDESNAKLLCPRCRCATLFRIPFDPGEPD